MSLRVTSFPIASVTHASVGDLFPRVELDEFYDYNQILHSNKKFSFHISSTIYIIQKSIVKTHNCILYAGLRNGHRVFIKLFAEADDHSKELSILRESGSKELLESFIGKYPILVLKYTAGKVLSEIMRDFIIAGHLELYPQDRALVGKMWPNYEEISNDEFQKICSKYSDGTYIVKVGDDLMIHEALDPEKVLITPDLRVKVIDFTNVRKIPKNELDQKLLYAKAQETLIDSFNRYKKALEDETLADIREGKIPEEILFNLNYDSAISQIEPVSQIEETQSYDNLIGTIKEGNLFDSYDIDFPPLRRDIPPTQQGIRQDLQGSRMNRRVKSLKNIRSASLSDSKDYNTDLLSKDKLNWDSDHTDITVHAGSRARIPQMHSGFEDEVNDIPNVIEQSRKKFGFWESILGANQNLKNDLPSDGDEDGGMLILESDDDYFVGSLEPSNAQLHVGSKDFNPSSSTLSDSFYSATSDLYKNVKPPPVDITTRMRKPRSTGNLSRVGSSDGTLSNQIRQASSVISSMHPNSPVSPNAKNTVMLRRVN